MAHHIALVTPYFFPANGGIASFVTGLRDALVSLGHRCSVITVEGAQAHGVEIAAGSKLAIALNVLVCLARLRPDVVHVHGHWYLMLGALAFARIFRCPLVLTNHTDRVPVGRMRRHLLSWLMNRFDQVVSVSRFMQAREQQWFKVTRPRRSIVYAGIELPDQPVVLRENAVRLVAVSNFVWEAKTEGVALLVRSMKEVTRRFPDARLDVIGDGPYRHLVEEAIQVSGMGGRVHLLGAVPSPRVRQELLSADMFVHVSFQDALPMVILEAMSVGLPIVATPVGGIGEILTADRNSILVDLNCSAVADGISRVLADGGLRRRLRDQCLRDAKRFEWAAAGAAYDAIYRSLMLEPSG